MHLLVAQEDRRFAFKGPVIPLASPNKFENAHYATRNTRQSLPGAYRQKGEKLVFGVV